MQVTFGLFLDRRQGPSPNNYFNNPLVGRQGFLSLLETYLGLAAPEVAESRRVAVYAGLLSAADNGARFYSASRATDSVGTAATLLAWRDEWRLGGWSGDARPEDPVRISELAFVEMAAQTTLPPGEAERLIAVMSELQATGPGPIKSVRLADPLEDFPLLWRRALEHLPDVQVFQPTPQGTGALLEVQEQALSLMSAQGPRTLAVPEDGSVQLVKSLSATTAEHWLSACHVANPGDRLVLAEERGASLDTFLSATGSPACGFSRASPCRPALQALPLALELCWAPLDVPRLLDFLAHPIGPFSRKARAKLAETLAQQPGVGGRQWNAVKAKLAVDDQSHELLEEISFWIEGQRWSRIDGIPAEVLLSRVDRMKDVFRRRLVGDSADAPTFTAAYRQCASTVDALKELLMQGQTRVLPRQLEQLVARATPGGATNSTAYPQVGCMRSSSIAAACIEPAEEVIWWMPATPQLPQALPWSADEVGALRQMGVHLRDPSRELKSLALQWLRPLLAAKKRFLIVAPTPGSEVHPMRQLLALLMPTFESGALDLDAALSSSLAETMTEVATRKPLPKTEGAIQLSGPVALSGSRQSFTSLTELFNAPALFTLKRVARLKSSSVLTVDEDNRLLGTLAHRMFEKLFEHEDALTWSNDKALQWFRDLAAALLQEEGALLLMQGAGVSQQRFRLVCEHALCSLLDHLRSARATRVIAEQSFEGVLGDMPLTGSVDLQVMLDDGRTVALDMKWRRDSYYAGLLSAGEHLQLAIYSSLIEQQTGTAPVALGYFILESGALYVSQPDIFPNAQVRQVPDGVTVSTLLQRARATWNWRKEQLSSGLIDVVPEGFADGHQGPEGTLPIKGPSKWDRDHLVLLGGWE